MEASKAARSGPRFSTDARQAWEWHEGMMVRRVFPARVWTRLSCVTGKKFSWSDSQAQSLAARTAGPATGESGSGNMDKEVEAEKTHSCHCGGTCDARAATRLITARIMPTPGTEIAKASLADSSLVCHSSGSPGRTWWRRAGCLPRPISHHLDRGAWSCTEAIRV